MVTAASMEPPLDGPYDVILAPTAALARNANRRRALQSDAGLFDLAAEGFSDWIDSLWGLYGDGRVPSSPLQESLVAQSVVSAADLHRLEVTPGLADAIAECAREGFGVPSFDQAVSEAQNDGFGTLSELTAQEWEFLACVGAYRDALEAQGLISFGEILGYLARHSAEVFPRVLTVRMLGERPLTVQQRAFFDGCPQLRLHHDEELAPAPLGRVPNLDLAMAFPAGGYAQGQLLLHVVRAMVDRFHGGAIVIVATDPLDLYRRIGPALAAQGISCAATGTAPFACTEFGRAFLSARRASAPGTVWDKDGFTDALRSAILGLSKGQVWHWDRRLRGDRLLSRVQVLSEAAQGGFSGSSAPAMVADLDALATDGTLSDSVRRGFQALRAQGLPEAFIAEQQGACAALLRIIRTARELGCHDGPTIDRLIAKAQLPLSVVCPPDWDESAPGIVPAVRIVNPHQGTQLPAGDARGLILCDLTTEAQPLRESSGAVEQLLRTLGAGPRQSALGKARQDFRALLAVAADEVVLERQLNDAGADPLYPSAMLEEFARAYREEGFPATALEKRLGFPEALLQRCYEWGEEHLIADVRPALDPGPSAVRAEALPPADFLGSRRDHLVPHGAAQLHPDLPRLSPSQIEAYLDCPYKWFLTRRLGVSGLDEELGPREEGTFLHEVFQCFYRRFGVKVTRENLDRARLLMFGEGGEPGVFDEVLRAQYAPDGAGHPRSGRFAPRPGTSEEREAAHLRLRVDRWLDFETTFLPGFTPVAFECRIDGVVYEGCELSAFIDRIDVDDQGRAVVIDYKGALKGSHCPCAKGDYLESAKVQALMYARILEEAGAVALSPDGEASFVPLGACAEAPVGRSIAINSVAGALYASYNKGNGVRGAFDRAVLGPQAIPTLQKPDDCGLPTGEGIAFADLLDHTAQRVGDAVRAITAGAVERHPSSPEACQYCPLEKSCEKRWR